MKVRPVFAGGFLSLCFVGLLSSCGGRVAAPTAPAVSRQAPSTMATGATAAKAGSFLNPDDVNPLRSREILFPGAALNGHPVQVILDTYASTYLTSRGVEKAGLKPAASPADVEAVKRATGHWLTEPTSFTFGSQNLTVQFNTPVLRAGHDDSYGVEAMLGWRAVRHNILFFDSARHVVTRLDKLPAEIADWTKLKIRSDFLLAVDLPLADGRTGALRLDTGAAMDGVALPPELYQQWRAAHPAALTWHQPYTENKVDGVMEESWADEVQVGPLTLTDLPVRAENKMEGTWTDSSAGVLGIYALDRLDLILDGDAGNAYLRPKPSGPRHSPYRHAADLQNAQFATKVDWLIDPNVQLDHSNFVEMTTALKIGAKDFAGAIADCDQAIKLDPSNPYLYLRRGQARQGAGDLEAANTDFTEALRLDPGNSQAKAGLDNSRKEPAK